jgi:hypothetical protein
MPAYVRGTPRNNLTFVRVNDYPLLYGWRAPDFSSFTGITAADITALGHLTAVGAAAVPNRIMILGANSPKPARVTKKLSPGVTTERGSVSTFCAYNQGAAAVAAGWATSRGAKGVSVKPAAAGRRSQTAVAELSNGVLYAFPLNSSDFAIAAADLGLQSAGQISATERKRLATGMSKTRPGKAAKEDSDGLFVTYYSTASADTAATAGWDILSSEVVQFSSPSTP